MVEGSLSLSQYAMPCGGIWLQDHATYKDKDGKWLDGGMTYKLHAEQTRHGARSPRPGAARFLGIEKGIVSGSADTTVGVWDTDSGQPIGAPLTGHSGPVESVAFSPDGKRIVSGSADTTVRMWDAGTGQPVGAPLTGHANAVRSVAFSPDGKRMALSS